MATKTYTLRAGTIAAPTTVTVKVVPERSKNPMRRDQELRIRAGLCSTFDREVPYLAVTEYDMDDDRRQDVATDLAAAVEAAEVLGFAKGLAARLDGVVLFGEVSVCGALRPVRGIVPRIHAAHRAGASMVIVPEANGTEAVRATFTSPMEWPWPTTPLIRTARTLRDVIDYNLSPPGPDPLSPDEPEPEWLNIPESVERAVVIAAAGRIPLLLSGPPGCGSTLLARRLPRLLPEPQREERRLMATYRSVVGLDHDGGLSRPFRAPHHTVSSAGMVGGGLYVRPGEVHLAHGGVLFLDQVDEFKLSTLDEVRAIIGRGYTVHPLVAGTSVVMTAAPWVVGATEGGGLRDRRIPSWFGVRTALERVSIADLPDAANSVSIKAMAADVARTCRFAAERRQSHSDGIGDVIAAVARTIADAAFSLEVQADHYAEALRLAGG